MHGKFQNPFMITNEEEKDKVVAYQLKDMAKV